MVGGKKSVAEVNNSLEEQTRILFDNLVRSQFFDPHDPVLKSNPQKQDLRRRCHLLALMNSEYQEPKDEDTHKALCRRHGVDINKVSYEEVSAVPPTVYIVTSSMLEGTGITSMFYLEALPSDTTAYELRNILEEADVPIHLWDIGAMSSLVHEMESLECGLVQSSYVEDGGTGGIYRVVRHIDVLLHRSEWSEAEGMSEHVAMEIFELSRPSAKNSGLSTMAHRQGVPSRAVALNTDMESEDIVQKEVISCLEAEMGVNRLDVPDIRKTVTTITRWRTSRKFPGLPTLAIVHLVHASARGLPDTSIFQTRQLLGAQSSFWMWVPTTLAAPELCTRLAAIAPSSATGDKNPGRGNDGAFVDVSWWEPPGHWDPRMSISDVHCVHQALNALFSKNGWYAPQIRLLFRGHDNDSLFFVVRSYDRCGNPQYPSMASLRFTDDFHAQEVKNYESMSERMCGSCCPKRKKGVTIEREDGGLVSAQLFEMRNKFWSLDTLKMRCHMVHLSALYSYSRDIATKKVVVAGGNFPVEGMLRVERVIEILFGEGLYPENHAGDHNYTVRKGGLLSDPYLYGDMGSLAEVIQNAFLEKEGEDTKGPRVVDALTQFITKNPDGEKCARDLTDLAAHLTSFAFRYDRFDYVLCPQHGNMHPMSIIVDSQNLVWLMDFRKSNVQGFMYHDMTKLESSLIMEHAVSSLEFAKVEPKLQELVKDIYGPDVDMPWTLGGERQYGGGIDMAYTTILEIRKWAGVYCADTTADLRGCALQYYSAMLFRYMVYLCTPGFDIVQYRTALLAASMLSQRVRTVSQRLTKRNRIASNWTGSLIEQEENLAINLDQRDVFAYGHEAIEKFMNIIHPISKEKSSIFDILLPTRFLPHHERQKPYWNERFEKGKVTVDELMKEDSAESSVGKSELPSHPETPNTGNLPSSPINPKKQLRNIRADSGATIFSVEMKEGRDSIAPSVNENQVRFLEAPEVVEDYSLFGPERWILESANWKHGPTHLLVVGAPTAGKTTTMIQLFLLAMFSSRTYSGGSSRPSSKGSMSGDELSSYIPLYIPLLDFVDETQELFDHKLNPLEQYMAKTFSSNSRTLRMMRKWRLKGKLFLFIDGFDYIRQECLPRIVTFLQMMAGEGHRLVVSMCPACFTEVLLPTFGANPLKTQKIEEKASRRFKKKVIWRWDWSLLQELNENTRRGVSGAFLSKSGTKEEPGKFVGHLSTSYYYTTLSRYPFTLSLLCHIYLINERKLPIGRDSPKVYSAMVNGMLDGSGVLSSEVRNFVDRLAYELHMKGEGSRDFLGREANFLGPEQWEMLQPLVEGGDLKILVRVGTESDDGQPVYRFPTLEIQEYLAANHLGRKLLARLDGSTAALQEVNNSLNAQSKTGDLLRALHKLSEYVDGVREYLPTLFGDKMRGLEGEWLRNVVGFMMIMLNDDDKTTMLMLALQSMENSTAQRKALRWLASEKPIIPAAMYPFVRFAGLDRKKIGAHPLPNFMQSLCLNDCDIEAEDAMRLVSVLLKCETLSTLRLCGNNMFAEGMPAVADLLKSSASLLILNLEDNHIGDEGATHLSKAIETNGNLQSLYLGHNAIGPKGTVALAQALTKNVSIRLFYLGYNNIMADGVAALCECLETNTTLDNLSLKHNNVGRHGASVLNHMLRQNTTLKSLKLGGNRFSHDGVTSLCNALEVNTGLRSLFFGNNDVTDSGATAFAHMLKKNKTLEELYLGGNKITIGGQKELETVCIEENKVVKIKGFDDAELVPDGRWMVGGEDFEFD